MNISELIKEVSGQVDKKFGEGKNRQEITPRKHIKTSVLAIDKILGGGIPSPAIIECFGQPSSGKSAFSFLAAASFQKQGGIVVYFDTEESFDFSFTKYFDVDPERLMFFPNRQYKLTIEFVLNTILYLIEQLNEKSENAPVLIIWDSVAGSPCARDLEQKSEMGQRGLLLSQGLRVISGVIGKGNTTLLFVNQERSNVGVLYGPKLVTPCGNAIKFHAHIRLEMQHPELILDERKNVIGILGGIKTVKNKTFPPFKECEFKLVYNQNFDPYWGLAEVLYKEGILEKKGGWFHYLIGDKDIRFASKNIQEVIEKYPALLEGIQ